MGMFDWMQCDADLPKTAVAPPNGFFQTKDTPSQYLIQYTITADGFLHSPSEKLADFHGDIFFYTGNHPDVGWWEYRARFTEGRLSNIILVEFRAPEGRDRNAEIEAIP